MKIEFTRFEPEDLAQDLAQYVAWQNQPTFWEADNTKKYKPLVAEDVREWFVHRTVKPPYSFKLWVDGRWIGCLGFKDYVPGKKEVEFFIAIGEIAEWGKGIGRQALKQLIALGRIDLKLEKITGRVLGSNRRALRLYEGLGFKVVGHGPPSFWRAGRKFDMVKIELVLRP